MSDATPSLDAARHLQEVQKLFLQHADLLRGFVRGLLPQEDLAEDLFQDLFMTLTAKAADFQLGSNFLAWARTIARVKVLEQYRRLKRSVPLLSAEVLELLADDVAVADAYNSTRCEALRQCLQEVAPRAREIVALRYADPPLTPRQIAYQVSWTPNAVRVALARTRKFLFECVERRLAAEGAH